MNISLLIHVNYSTNKVNKHKKINQSINQNKLLQQSNQISIKNFQNQLNLKPIKSKQNQADLSKILNQKEEYAKQYFHQIKKIQNYLRKQEIMKYQYQMPQIKIGKWTVKGYIFNNHLILKGKKEVIKNDHKQKSHQKEQINPKKLQQKIQKVKQTSQDQLKQKYRKYYNSIDHRNNSRSDSSNLNGKIGQNQKIIEKQQLDSNQKCKQLQVAQKSKEQHRQNDKKDSDLLQKQQFIQQDLQKISGEKDNNIDQGNQKKSPRVINSRFKEQKEVLLQKKYNYSKVYEKVKQNYYQFVYDRFYFQK